MSEHAPDQLSEIRSDVINGFKTLATAINVRDEKATEAMRSLESRVSDLVHGLNATRSDINRLTSKIEPVNGMPLETQLVRISDHMERADKDRTAIRTELIERIDKVNERVDGVEDRIDKVTHNGIKWLLGGIVSLLTFGAAYVWDKITHLK